MRAGIAEPVRRRADLRRGTGRDPPGPGVDVGRRHHRHPGCVGDLAQGRPVPSLNHGYAFWLYAFGPALALLQAELRFSYTMLGVYSALWSAGAALAGLSFARLA